MKTVIFILAGLNIVGVISVLALIIIKVFKIKSKLESYFKFGSLFFIPWLISFATCLYMVIAKVEFYACLDVNSEIFPTVSFDPSGQMFVFGCLLNFEELTVLGSFILIVANIPIIIIALLFLVLIFENSIEREKFYSHGHRMRVNRILSRKNK